MRHYSLEQWIDFARNVTGPRERAEMENHLSAGCRQCSKTLSLWQRVYEASRHESRYAPPESVVGTVKGMFGIRGPRKIGRAGRAVASLLFDSARSPLPEGVRSVGRAERQMLFGVSRYRIDVRIEPQANPDKVALVGQILNFAAPGESIGGVPVRLHRGRSVLAESITSPFGEFYLECSLRKGSQLRVKLPREELRLPLAEAIIEFSQDGPEAYDPKKVRSLAVKDKKRTRKKV
jgi:hypothetical protein